jgi:hypothetical protein
MTVSINGTNGLTFNDASTQNTAASGFGFKNRIINGGIQIAQRGTTYALTTSIAYGSIDRFAALQATAANGVLAQVASGLTGFTYALKAGRNNAATGTGIVEIAQAIESQNSMDLQGNPVTLSFWAKAGANFSAASSLITVQLASGTGTDQSISAQTGGSWTGVTYPINTTQAITTAWVRYSLTGTLPSNTNQVGIQIYYTPVGTASADDNIYITGVQLEKGSTATSFDYRPYGTELALCQRYYEKSFDIGTAPAQAAGTAGASTMTQATAASLANYGWQTPYKVTKRAAPSLVTLYNPVVANANAYNDIIGVSCSSTGTEALSSTNFLVLQFTSAVGSSVGQSNIIHWSATAEL